MSISLISNELRKKWSALDNKSVLSKLESLGLFVELKNSRNRHFKITGKTRVVELYATTGTVNSAPQGKMNACSYKGMEPERAFKRILSLANIGY